MAKAVEDFKKGVFNLTGTAAHLTGTVKNAAGVAENAAGKVSEAVENIDAGGIVRNATGAATEALGVGSKAVKFTGKVLSGITNTASGLGDAAASTIQRNWRARMGRIQRNKEAQDTVYNSDEYKKMKKDEARMRLMREERLKVKKWRKREAVDKERDMINHKFNACKEKDHRVIEKMKQEYCNTTECSNDFNKRFQKWMKGMKYGRDQLCEYYKDCIDGSMWLWSNRDNCKPLENILDPIPIKGGKKIKNNKKKRTIRRKNNKKKRTIRRKNNKKKRTIRRKNNKKKRTIRRKKSGKK